MSASDDFTDYYEILQVSPNAGQETIQRVYRLLAQMYHPDNRQTGNIEMFQKVVDAYSVLSDPEKRAAYDVQHRSRRTVRWRIFDQQSGVQGFEAERRKRTGILSLLYAKRMHEPHQPALTIVDLEQLLGCPREHLELSLWYLRESGRIQRSDSGRYAITAKGLETLEESASVETDRRLLAAPAADPAKPC